jgi:hypothetical protein
MLLCFRSNKHRMNLCRKEKCNSKLDGAAKGRILGGTSDDG